MVRDKRDFLIKELNKALSWRYLKYSSAVGPGLGKKIKRLFYAPEIYIPHILFKYKLFPLPHKTVKTKLFWGREIELEIRDEDSYFFSKYPPLAEINLIKFFIKNLRENDIFYDVGANYGLYTYLALELCQEVHSFEPIPYIYKSLKNNLLNEKRAFIYNIALSNKNGMVDFYINKIHSGSSTTINEIVNHSKEKKHYMSVRVKSLTLDDFLKNHPFPTFIKLDVEGGESNIIEGGINFFKNFSPVISLEVVRKEEWGHLSMIAVEKLRALGYNSFFIDENGEISKIDGDLSVFNSKRKILWDNYIFKKS